MNLSPESYDMIYGFIIAAVIMSIFIIICIKYHDTIMRFCKRNQVVPEQNVYSDKSRLEIKPV